MLELSNGNVLLTWQSNGQDGSELGIYGKVIDASGNTIKSEFRINEYTNNSQDSQQMLLLTNGNVLITWTSNGQDGSYLGVYGKVIDRS